MLIAFALLLPLLAAAQESVVWVDPSMEQAKPEDLKYLAAFKGRPRAFDVRLHQRGATETRRQRVMVIGALSKSQVVALLQSVLGADKIYWPRKYPTDISVVGDEHRARVSTTYVCGPLCGSSVSYLYTYESGGWRYLYFFDRLIS